MKKSKSKPKTKSKPHTVPAKVHAVPKTKTRNGTIQTIREVFGYLRRYRDQVFVIKIDDSLMDLPLFPLLIRDIVLLHQTGIRIVLVPGAKHSIDTVLQRYSTKTRTVGGVRVTTPEAMPLVKLGASNVSNVLLSLLAENETHGVVGNWVRARAIGVRDGLDYKQTGQVEKVN
ncbi:MAG TPA: amino-acid N-acetyltransferase, partial [Fibrobacteres bacterium]|nr:amino-acid N-acetyltransferase [Fibrobacterota bacterium]